MLIFVTSVFSNAFIVLSLQAQTFPETTKGVKGVVTNNLPTIIQIAVPDISENDKIVVLKYYSDLLDSVSPANISERFAVKYLSAVTSDMKRSIYGMRGYKDGAFQYLSSRNPKEDPRLKGLNASLLSEMQEVKLAEQIAAISDITRQTLLELLRNKSKIRFISSKDFDVFFDGYYKASESTFAAHVYDYPTNCAELFYRTNLHKLKCDITVQAIDYFSCDQKMVHLYCATNLFYNGMYQPFSAVEFEALKRNIVSELRLAYSGDTFVFEILSAPRVFSDPIEQLFKPEIRPKIRPVIFAKSEGEVFDNCFYKQDSSK